MRNASWWPWLVLASLVLLGCDPEKVPIAELGVEPKALKLSYPYHEDVKVHLTPLAYPIQGGCPMMFVHLLDHHGEIARTFDQPVPGWSPGKELYFSLTLFQSAMVEPLPPGTYRLTGGLYGPRSGKRFAVVFDGSSAGRLSYDWAQVDVPFEEETGPELDFLHGWETVKVGPGQQVQGSKWLHRQGSLALRGPSPRLDLWMLIKVPGDLPGFELEIEEGIRPELSLQIVCSGDAALLTPGLHEVHFEIPELGPSETCEIALQANFNLPAVGESPAGRSVSLQAVSWKPMLLEKVRP